MNRPPQQLSTLVPLAAVSVMALSVPFQDPGAGPTNLTLICLLNYWEFLHMPTPTSCSIKCVIISNFEFN